MRFASSLPRRRCRDYEETLDALVLPGLEGFEGTAGGAGLGVHEVFKLIFGGGPWVGLPHKEDGEDLVTIEGLVEQAAVLAALASEVRPPWA